MADSLPPPLRALLGGAIDYAGLFPPAALTLPDAVREYRACRDSPDRWALGRFVVPAARLAEFAEAARSGGLLPAPAADPVPVSALALADLAAGLAEIADFEARSAGQGVVVQAVECRATTPAEAARLAGLVPATLECWVEIPLGVAPGPMLDAILGAGAFPKIRTGGTSAELFPAADLILAFLAEVVRRGTPFKATAGLHHPLRGQYRYTYEPDSPAGPMYGYLNLFLATAFLMTGMPVDEAREVLLEEEPGALAVSADGIAWRGRRLDLPALDRVRRSGLRAFGSCSFREPLSELKPLVSR